MPQAGPASTGAEAADTGAIPRHAFVVFLWCSILTTVICLGSIIAFLVLMPDNEHGRQGIVAAVRSFGPYAIISAFIAMVSHRRLRWIRKSSTRNRLVAPGRRS